MVATSPTTAAVAADPVLDIERLAEIADLELFTPEVRRRLDAFARRAAERFDLPVGLVSIVLDSAQVFAGRHGVSGWMDAADGTPNEWSLCVNTVRDRAPYVVEDAATDERESDNPIVTVDGLRCYAGMPLTTSNGFVLGSFCVMGLEQREFTVEELTDLEKMTLEVVLEIESHRIPAPRCA